MDGSRTEDTNSSQRQHATEHEQREHDSQLGQSESCPMQGNGEKSQDSQDGSAAKGTELPQVQDPAGHRQGEDAALLEQRESCPGDGNGEESQDPQHGSAPRNIQDRIRQGCLGNWFTSHPVLTLAVLIVLLLLTVVFGVSLAVCSGRTQTEIPVLLACSDGWIGYRGICYFFSRDHHSWDQAQARCSERKASLAVLRDREIELLFRLGGNINHWLGLRRQDQGLQWVDGSSFTSSVEVLDNGDKGDCVFLRNGKFWSGSCSNERPYMCSKPQSTL